ILCGFSSAESHPLSDEELNERLDYLTNLVYPDIAEKSADTQRKMISKFNHTHRFPSRVICCDEGSITEGKLAPKYHELYKVMARAESGSYTLLDATNSQLLRNYAPEQLKLVTQALDASSDESFEVESIIGSQLHTKGSEN
ncbi:hypothetical protein BX616_000709, partial [Lobosporangium transversale]